MSTPLPAPISVFDVRAHLTELRRNFAIQDWLVLAFHVFMTVRIAIAPVSYNQHIATRESLILLSIVLMTVVLVRSELLPNARVRAIVYRLGVFTPTFVNYFVLRRLLPALEPTLLDAQLHEIDRLLFGETPSVYWDGYVNPITVEIFAFFYYSHFTNAGLHLIGSMLLDRGRRLAEIMFGALVIVGVGHIMYTLVPGVGPYAALTFTHPLTGGLWWSLVERAVDSAGAMLDIFPSLHTAYPVFFALHSWRYRTTAPYKYTFPIAAVFAFGIVGATMFLRWHYAIDVVAGIALAVFAQFLAIRVARMDRRRKRASGAQSLWVYEPLANFTWGRHRDERGEYDL